LNLESYMKRLTISIISLLFYINVFGQNAGSNIFMHTQSGRSYGAGHFEVYNQSAFYTASVGTITVPPPTPVFSGSSYWLVQNNFALVYGPVDHLDLILKLGFYQDAHYMSDFNFPDAITFTLKGGSLTFAGRHLYAAGMLNLSRPMGDTHNYPLVEYSSSAQFEFGVNSALSYYSDIYYPDNSFSAHLNVGYFSHNAAKSVTYNKNNLEILAGTNGVGVQYGLALIYPLRLVEFRVELSGIQYLQQPDTIVYGREDYMYVTPSIRYKPFHWLSIDLGFDYRISADEEKTTGAYLYSTNMGLPNYADWKAQIGLNFKIFPSAPPPKSVEQIKSEQFNQRIDYFRGMVEDRERLQNAREDIEAIKNERRRVEREIKELKQALEAQG
jgi:hypothetical protein